jgi:hypothetical protein
MASAIFTYENESFTTVKLIVFEAEAGRIMAVGWLIAVEKV